VLDLQTVSTQPVSTSRTSAGALRHAQSFVTSSQPDGSASPMGIRQLKMHDGCDVTWGRAVMVYSGDKEDIAAALGVALDVELTNWAMARATRRERMKRFIVGEEVMELNIL
jgi:hypothetical protein